MVESESIGRTEPRAQDALAGLLLRSLPGVGVVRFRTLVDRFGSPGAALRAPTLDFIALAGKAARNAISDANLRERAECLLERCRARTITPIVYGAPEYPATLHDLPDPPSVLFLAGQAELLNSPCVAIVGSRRATTYGRRVARQLGASMVARGHTVVSGLALGIDAAAHQGALPGPTIAVLGSGADVASPPSNHRLYQKILADGAVVSEYPPGTKVEPYHFPRRNRIIAALVSDVIIVEASRRSGALITAEVALNLGREVHAVPGPIDRPTSDGTNRLIRDGAAVIVDTGSNNEIAGMTSLPEEPNLRELLAALPAAPVTIDEAARLADLPIEMAAVSVTVLQLRGFLMPTRDGRVMRTPGNPRTHPLPAAPPSPLPPPAP